MSLDRLDGIVAFVRVAERRNFSAAARELGVTPQAVSQSVGRLERRIGASLFARTTRDVSLTEAGELLYATAGSAIADLADALEAASMSDGQPSGLLRINLPHFAAAELSPLIADFCRAHPAVRLELFVDDALANIVEQGFDAGIRLDEMLGGDMTCVRLTGPVRFLVVGAPSYFTSRGRPNRPEDLAQHQCINFRLSARGTPYAWEFDIEGREVAMEVQGSLLVNDSRIALEAARSGLGLHYCSAAVARPFIDRGELEPVLRRFCPQSSGFFLYYPSKQFVPPKLRAFIDFAASRR